MKSDKPFPQSPLQEVADVIDSLHATPTYASVGLPMVRVTDVKDGFLSLDSCVKVSDEVFAQFTRNHTPVQGDIVISRVGTYGVFSYVSSNDRFCLGQNTAVIHPHESSRFIYYALRSPQTRNLIEERVVGSTQKTLSLRHIRELPIPFPQLSERTAIAETLGALDDKIEQNRRMGRALEGLARATFNAWFVDFEPVKAKAAGQTSFPGLPLDAFATLPDRLTDSPIGPVPQGWAVRPIGDLVSVKGGGTPSTKVAEYWHGGTHFWATPKDLSGLHDPILLRTERRITDAGAECISSGVMPENTVLLSSRAPVGYTALAKVPVAVNQGFIAMTCDGPLPPHYLLHWTRSALEEIKSRASGTTFPEISKTAFRPIPAVVPTPRVVAEFEGFAQCLFDLIEASARQSRQLGDLRDFLLPRLLSGSVRVRQ